jgi:type I restriction enzyme R subunit
MREQLEDAFISGLLRNSTSYGTAYDAANLGDGPTVGRGGPSAKPEIWLCRHPHNLDQRVQVIVEHFRQHIEESRCKRTVAAIVVVSSRQEAIRYRDGLEKYITRFGYEDLCATVAVDGVLSAGDQHQVKIESTGLPAESGCQTLGGVYVLKILSAEDRVQTLARMKGTFESKADWAFLLEFMNDSRRRLDELKGAKFMRVQTD